eukprot:5108054-Prymnesium_polylepis.1
MLVAVDDDLLLGAVCLGAEALDAQRVGVHCVSGACEGRGEGRRGAGPSVCRGAWRGGGGSERRGRLCGGGGAEREGCGRNAQVMGAVEAFA